eukprot:15310215-Ditylum_brightwellii.AAC.1
MINALMEAVAIECVEKDPKFFELHNTTKNHAKYEVQKHPGCPVVYQNNKKIERDTVAVYA